MTQRPPPPASRASAVPRREAVDSGAGAATARGHTRSFTRRRSASPQLQLVATVPPNSAVRDGPARSRL